ncbi:hypothetical protein EVA_17921 [gut metagenome]|uniref:Uncharacterized protein n=1 Tax=gut metagenome TaxID=749906 RepID=J9FGC5_9ZZZZ
MIDGIPISSKITVFFPPDNASTASFISSKFPISYSSIPHRYTVQLLMSKGTGFFNVILTLVSSIPSCACFPNAGLGISTSVYFLAGISTCAT